MHASAPRSNSATVSSFPAVHRRFRRVRWLLLLSALVLYAILQIVIHLIMERFNLALDERIVDWSIAVLIGGSFTIGITRWEDRWVAHIEALEMERAAAERALMQLEVVQATARTVAHTINQPLAIIRGLAELYRETPLAERNDADLITILREVDRAADLVRQLLEISRYRTIPYAGGAPMLDLSPPPSSE
jgi:signal transduction histidine kinase